MDPVIWVALLVGVLVAMVFNYYLNLAPGSEPEDFLVGPEELAVKCDCFINVLIIPGISVLALSSLSALFSTRLEFYLVAIGAFAVVTLGGLLGRRRRHQEWLEMSQVLQRVLPETQRTYSSMIDRYFDEEDEFDDEDYF